MLKDKRFVTEGFLKDKSVFKKSLQNPTNLYYTFLGFELDKVKLTAEMNSIKDIDSVIKFLNNTKACLLKEKIKN